MTLPHRIASLAMQSRIQELLAKHKPIFKLDETEPASHPRTTLLGLPGELRNHIYEYALYHEDGRGMIAPAPDLRDRDYILAAIRNDTRQAAESAIPDLEAGEGAIYRFRMHGDAVAPFIINAANITQTTIQAPLAYTLAQFRIDRLSTKEPQRPNYVIDINASGQPRHICSLDCLLQPALTLVSKAVRQESLPVFYAINLFHFEMASFRLQRGRGIQTVKVARSPGNWWRAAGDTNLRAINDMVLVTDGHHVGIKDFTSVAVIYKKHGNTHSVTIREIRDPKKYQQQPNSTASQSSSPALRPAAERKLRSSPLFMSSKAKIEEGGLHVRSLERLLAAFGDETAYLVDQVSLK